MSLEPEILFEDEDILAINKPAGLIVHPASQQVGYGAGPDSESVSEWFVEKYPESKNVGEKLGEIERHGIVHRIDRETSGALLLAKTKKGYKVLKEQFQKREIEKIYHAFVYGIVADDRGTINFPITRSKKDFRKKFALIQSRQPIIDIDEEGEGGAREALTYFKVLKRFEEEKVTFIEAKPKTGRTHQIRVHLLAIHHPIISDRLYAPRRPRVLGFKRLALHARSLAFKDVSGQIHHITAEYPEDLREALDKVGYSVLD